MASRSRATLRVGPVRKERRKLEVPKKSFGLEFLLNEANLGPCTLEGRFVRLEPLRANHAAALAEVARGMDWGWMLGPLRSRDDVDRRITDGLKAEERNEEYAFAVSLKPANRVIGSTGYLAIAPKHKAAEIGRTWYSPDLWGTAVNPECKLLLLEHAFEDWGAIRVQLGTDGNNVHSQRAILKLGAKLEGRLRNHGIRPDGSVRDTILYSIISSEWPTVKKGLEARIRKFAHQHRSRIRVARCRVSEPGCGPDLAYPNSPVG